MKGSNLSRMGRELRPPEEIAAQVDQQSVLELRDQGEDVLQGLFKRAVLGEEQAIRVLIAHALGAVNALDDLERHQPSKLKMLAETHPNWPVLFSLNPQEIRRATDRITRLGVGQKAITPRRVKQRLDPADFWTQLAAAVLEECESHQVIVPVLETHCAGARRQRAVVKAWRTPVKLTFYYLDPQTRIRISDWQRQCMTLPKPITAANFKTWWDVAKLCLLEFWKSTESGSRIYDQALKKIPDRKAPKEFQKRNRAVAQVRKALRSLVGLRP